MNYESITSSVCEIARKTGAFIRNERNAFSADKIEVKGLHNFVSYVDKGAEELIVNELKKLLPQAGFIAEEGTASDNGETLKWIIDPLDGTTNFIHGLPPYAVSIALMENQQVVSGVVYEVTLDECFYTWKGGAAFCNGKIIKVSETQRVKDSLIATGFPYYDYDRLKSYLSTMEFFMKESHGMRRIGSAATDLAYVACGRFEAFYEYSLSPWDVAAGAFLVQQAGGTVTDFTGGDNYIFGREMVATNKNVYAEFSEIVQSIMVKK